ncbi:MAG: PDDEXK nuclease domain-containing protein [Prevotella sp.]|nr:PDDEXK nuclease domain-containing protein [Prevotella sp.]
MMKNINILDGDYQQWVQTLGSRYCKAQIKAAVKVNQELLRFYWELGRDIEEMHVEERWGEQVIKTLSIDLQRQIPNAQGFSRTNIYYAKKFYLLYSDYFEIVPQVVGQLEESLFSMPWGHHRFIIDKCYNNPKKAMFYVQQTIENGWSRSMLLNFLDIDLYERQGKALSNFSKTLPDEMSDFAQELVKDPYDFAFTGITGKYNERLLKDALVNNITKFLIELGTGFAYVGKEYRLQIGETENFLDLLFYNLKLSCYVVVEVKIGKLCFADAGQLSGYVVACNHLLRQEGRDNPTIGLLICKEKDSLVAQYALESSSQPLGISEYDLAALYPEKIDGTIPSIKEIEEKLRDIEIDETKDKLSSDEGKSAPSP